MVCVWRPVSRVVATGGDTHGSTRRSGREPFGCPGDGMLGSNESRSEGGFVSRRYRRVIPRMGPSTAIEGERSPGSGYRLSARCRATEPPSRGSTRKSNPITDYPNPTPRSSRGTCKFPTSDPTSRARRPRQTIPKQYARGCWGKQAKSGIFACRRYCLTGWVRGGTYD